MAKKATVSPRSPAEELETFILLSHRVVGMISSATILTNRNLSMQGFALLASIGAEPGKSAGKLTRRARLKRDGALGVIRRLKGAGLVKEEAAPEGKGTVLSLTPEGENTLAEIRADLDRLSSSVPATAFRAVPRAASIATSLRIALKGDQADAIAA